MSRPAYPAIGNVGHNSDWQTEHGMTLREYYAAHAPVSMKEAWGIWADDTRLPFGKTVAGGSERGPFLQFFASLRFEYADAMLKEADGED